MINAFDFDNHRRLENLFEKIILIGNPIAGGNALKKIYKALRIFKDKGFDTTLFLTKDKGDAETFSKDNRDKAATLFVVAGGDGTYNEVANGLVGSNSPMAILPVGTTSVLAKELRMPKSIAKAIDYILTGTIKSAHLGRITFMKDLKNPRFFLLMAGIGFDGEAVFGVNRKIKRYFGKLGYITSGLKVLCNYNPKPFEIIIAYEEEIIKKPASLKVDKVDFVDGKGLALRGYFSVVGKSACYGGHFKFTPHARLTDETFYIFIAHGKSRFSILKYFIGMALHRHLNFKDISYIKTKKVEIWGNSKVQIDGDYVGTTPIRIEVVPNSLKLIVKDY